MAAAAENAAKEGASADGAPERVLNQMKLTRCSARRQERKRCRRRHPAILDKALSGFEKMPMLEVVFDRLVRLLASSLRNFTSDNGGSEPRVHHLAALRGLLNSIPLPALLAVFRAVEWDNLGILTFDSSQIYSSGGCSPGRPALHAPHSHRRQAYTTIEQDIVKRMSEIVLTDLSAAFDPVSPSRSSSSAWKRRRASRRSRVPIIRPCSSGCVSKWKNAAARSKL